MESAAYEKAAKTRSGQMQNSINILSLIAQCHDAHQEHLLEEEANLQVHLWMTSREYVNTEGGAQWGSSDIFMQGSLNAKIPFCNGTWSIKTQFFFC